MHCWPCLSCKLKGTARFYGRASKYPKMHCWPCRSWKLKGTARFYGRASKYPKMHCWPRLSCKLEGTARFYDKASKYPKMHCWPCLSCKLQGTARFYDKASKYLSTQKCTVDPIFHAKWRKQPDLNGKWDRSALNALLALYFLLEGTARCYGNRGSASLFAVYRKITWKIKRAHWLNI